MMLRQMRIAGAPCGLLVRITAPTYTSTARAAARRLLCVAAVGRRVHCLRPWGGGHPASSGPLLGPCIVSASRPPIATGHARFIRQFSDFSTKYRDEIQDLTDKFLEAKDSIEDANDSFETTYFDEDMDDAREAVGALEESFLALSSMCTGEEMPELQKVVGLKLEEVKASFEQLEEMALED